MMVKHADGKWLSYPTSIFKRFYDFFSENISSLRKYQRLSTFHTRMTILRGKITLLPINQESIVVLQIQYNCLMYYFRTSNFSRNAPRCLLSPTLYCLICYFYIPPSLIRSLRERITSIQERTSRFILYNSLKNTAKNGTETKKNLSK